MYGRSASGGGTSVIFAWFTTPILVRLSRSVAVRYGWENRKRPGGIYLFYKGGWRHGHAMGGPRT